MGFSTRSGGGRRGDDERPSSRASRSNIETVTHDNGVKLGYHFSGSPEDIAAERARYSHAYDIDRIQQGGHADEPAYPDDCNVFMNFFNFGGTAGDGHDHGRENIDDEENEGIDEETDADFEGEDRYDPGLENVDMEEEDLDPDDGNMFTETNQNVTRKRWSTMSKIAATTVVGILVFGAFFGTGYGINKAIEGSRPAVSLLASLGVIRTCPLTKHF